MNFVQELKRKISLTKWRLYKDNDHFFDERSLQKGLEITAVRKDTKVLRVVRTCSVFPDQYEIDLDNGHKLYVRLRWGVFTIEISASQSWNILDALEGPVMHSANVRAIEIGIDALKKALSLDWSDAVIIDKFSKQTPTKKEDLINQLKVFRERFFSSLSYHIKNNSPFVSTVADATGIWKVIPGKIGNLLFVPKEAVDTPNVSEHLPSYGILPMTFSYKFDGKHDGSSNFTLANAGAFSKFFEPETTEQ